MENSGLWSKAKYYVAIGVATLGIGLIAGVKYQRELRHAKDVVDYNLIQGMEKLEEHVTPNETMKKLGEWHLIHVLRVADSPEELEKKGAERKASLKKRIEAYNSIAGSDNPSSER